MSRSNPDSFHLVAISQHLPGSHPQGVNGEFSRMSIVTSIAGPGIPPPADQSALAFVKGAKRKRLSKACDACHKSKRRCDGTAPCGNCYFASKECTYTDAFGRPVPAPRNIHPDRLIAQAATGVPLHTPPAHAGYHIQSQPVQTAGTVRPRAEANEPSSKRSRAEGVSPRDSASPISPSGATNETDSPFDILDPQLTHELINLFFTHCHPQRLIIHKPSFMAALANDSLPPYLILSLCALAAPWHDECVAKATMPRLAGVRFFLQAKEMMFDAAGHLSCPPSLAVVQTLCLLEMHEIAASHSWTSQYRFFDLVLKILDEGLQLAVPDNEVTVGQAPRESRTFVVERECLRRCFWIVQCYAWINGIYTYRIQRARNIELARMLRLPFDEISFELARLPSNTEYLHVPAPKTKSASLFGHMCRMLSMYQMMQSINTNQKEVPEVRLAQLAQCRKDTEFWLSTLPPNLTFNKENLQKQIAMFETSSNTGGWCYCFIHSLHPCYTLELDEAQGVLLPGDPNHWARGQLAMIFDAMNGRARDTILSACVLWTYSKYYPKDPKAEEWDQQFYEMWGYKVSGVADLWRETQEEQNRALGRTYPVEGVVSQPESPPTFIGEKVTPSPRTSPTTSANTSPQQERSTARSRQRPSDTAGDGVRSSATTRSNSIASSASRHRQSQYIPERAAPNPAPAAVSGTRQGNSASLHHTTSLPSLKASGLLDSWKPTQVPMDVYNGVQHQAGANTILPQMHTGTMPPPLGQPAAATMSRNVGGNQGAIKPVTFSPSPWLATNF